METSCDLCTRTDFEGRIVWENDNFFIVATRGQITEGGYLILSPKKHILCFGEMSDEILSEAENLSEQIKESLKKEYDVPQVHMFEHGIVGQTIKHAHLHFLPGLCPDVMSRVLADFPEATLSFINSISELPLIYQKGGNLVERKPYLMVDDLYPQIFINPKNVPPQYLRIVYAKAMGRPERANWRDVDPKEDRKLILDTVSRMKKYF